MGNAFSDNSQNSNIGHRARKMLNVRPGSNHTDHQTIKFSRGDLVNTVSSLDLNSVFEQHGGSKNIDLHNIPSRNRYEDYATTKTMKPFAGGSRGVIGAVSSSNGDLSAIKNMIMGTQTGGGSCGKPDTATPSASKSVGCGCETNEVLQNGGKLDLASLLVLQNNLSAASTSYNPLNSMTPLHGGNFDLTSESSSLNILTDSAIMAGGANNSRRMFSVTSPFTETHNGLTATSPFNQSQMNQLGGGLLSSTSYSENNGFSATSTFNQSQNNQFGGVFSATSTFNENQDNQFGGALSTTSSMPINYDNLIGGKNKKAKAKIVRRSSASSSTNSTSISSLSRSTKSSNPSSSTIMNDMDDSSESTASESESNEDDIIARALKSDHHENVMRRDLSRLSSDKHANKEKKHSKKSSDSSSSTMTISGSTSTNSTSKSGSSSATSISSSETPNEAIAKVGMARFNNILLTSPNNDTVSDSLINAKQFYSSDHGDLYSSSSNFLRNNINKNRLR
jgi:hypothetical protein